MSTPRPQRASFRALSEATPADWALMERAERAHRQAHGPAGGLLNLLRSLIHADPLGAPVNLYAHSLQTATRVYNDAGDDELVVVALFHDVGEAISDNHHGLVAAEMLAPWISARRRWLLIHHVEFQALHFANHPTRDPHERDVYQGHPCFDETAHFCEAYDQNSFDPGFPTLTLGDFEPIVRRFFAGPVPPVVRPG